MSKLARQIPDTANKQKNAANQKKGQKNHETDQPNHALPAVEQQPSHSSIPKARKKPIILVFNWNLSGVGVQQGVLEPGTCFNSSMTSSSLT